jgi:phospholipase C
MEHLQNAGVTWQFYQNPTDEYAEDILTQFTKFKFETPQPNNPLYTRGVARGSNNSMAAFYEQAMAGTLPQVSWIIADQELSEHPPWLPQDGGWIQGQVVEAVTKGASFQNTALIISYDGQFAARTYTETSRIMPVSFISTFANFEFRGWWVV